MNAAAIITSEQHDRSMFMGGSDIAAVLGLSPWKTPIDLWREKTQPRIEEGQVSGPKLRGKRWEAVVAEMLAERLTADGHRVEIIGANRRYADPKHPWMACEIDFEIALNDQPINVELKTVHPFRMKEWGQSGTDTLPVYYTSQVMWGLGVTGKQEALCAALFGADELRVYPVERDEAVIAWMRAEAVKFWVQNVQAGVCPAPRTFEDLDFLYPTDSEQPAVQADPDLASKVLRLRAINEERSAREAEADALTFDIRRAMGDRTELVMPNGKTAITWKERSGKYLAETALKDAHPKIHKEFSRTWSKRVFLLKSFSTEGL